MSTGDAPKLNHLTSIPLGGPPLRPVPIAGTTLDGQALTLNPLEGTRPTVLLFLGGHCDGCDALADLLDGAGLPEGVEVVGIVPGEDHPKGGGLEAFADRRASVLRAPGAFADYRVPAPPFYVIVLPREGVVAAEGVPLGASDVVSRVNELLA